MATPNTGDLVLGTNAVISESVAKQLTDLPAELLEHILCFPVLNHIDICNVSCACKRLHDVCHGRGKVWAHQYKLRWHKLKTFLKLDTSINLHKKCVWSLIGGWRRAFSAWVASCQIVFSFCWRTKCVLCAHAERCLICDASFYRLRTLN